jgi:hypothetical protein
VSTGIAVDLRYLEQGDAGDKCLDERVHRGSTCMPKFGNALLGRQTLWAFRNQA